MNKVKITTASESKSSIEKSNDANTKPTSDVKAAHRTWQANRAKRRCQDFSEMLYWENVSTCSAL